MVTTVNKTIGTGGDYSTPQLWEDAAPANLVTSDQVWRGLCKLQTFSTSSTVLVVSGSTVDSTRYKELTTDTAASFADDAGKLTNPLRIDTSKGATLQSTYSGGYGGAKCVNSTEDYFRISKLQIIGAPSGSTSNGALALTGAGMQARDLIVEQGGSGATTVVSVFGASTITNVVSVSRGSSASTYLFGLIGGANAQNCTGVATSTACNGVQGLYTGGTVRNLALFGVKSGGTIDTQPTYSNCYTDKASPPTGFSTIAFDTTTGSGFENITDGTHDLRIKSTSALVAAGTSTGSPSADIVGTSRPQGAAYDVGAWEYTAAAGGFFGRPYYELIGHHTHV